MPIALEPELMKLDLESLGPHETKTEIQRQVNQKIFESDSGQLVGRQAVTVHEEFEPQPMKAFPVELAAGPRGHE